MVTKWKKCKAAASYVAFILTVTLLLGNILLGIVFVSGTYRSGTGLGDAMDGDYQSTAAFRKSITGYLENFLEMAAGGNIDNFYSYSSDVVYAYDSSDSTEYAQEATSAEGNEPTPKEQAQQYHETIKNDRNLLYTISYDGKQLYANTDEGELDGPSAKLPKGYNFLLYFDGEKVRIYKDGKEIDVYGDGYYRESSDWYVPGYHNFTGDAKTRKSTVCIAAIESPLLFVKGNYSSYGAESALNRLYSLQKDMDLVKKTAMAWGVLGTLFLVSLIACLSLRREKVRVDQKIALKTSRVWAEIKLVLGAVSLFMLLVFGIQILREFSYSLRGSFDINSGFYWNDFSYSVSSMLAYSAVLLIPIWILYFLVNDWRYNRKLFTPSILVKTYGFTKKLFYTKNLEMSVQKKIVYRYLPVFAGQCLVALLALMFLFVMFIQGNMNYYYGVGFTFFFILIVLLTLGMLAAQIWYAKKHMQTAEDLGTLFHQIKSIRDGDLSTTVPQPEDPDLAQAAQNLNSIREGMNIALQEQMKSERMKVELVSNVSHDIKTPLTSIISYVDLMNQEPDLPEHIKDYVHILENKSQRLKAMVQDVFEISKAASHQLPIKMETIDFGKLLRQTLADMSESIEKSTVSIKTRIPENSVMIWADGQRLYRVFQNLFQNALQYSMERSRVYITLETKGSAAIASVKNISRQELPDHIDFTERFTRGDMSRTDGGSGLGLSIARSFAEACGGKFRVEVIADLFVVSIEFQCTNSDN